MANMIELLREVAEELLLSGCAVRVYHAALQAGAMGKKVEAKMDVTEKKVAAIAERLARIQIAANEGNLATVQQLLAEDIVIPD